MKDSRPAHDPTCALQDYYGSRCTCGVGRVADSRPEEQDGYAGIQGPAPDSRPGLKRFKADGWMVQHHGSNFTANFGPFDSFADAVAFQRIAGFGTIIPLFKTVDWTRDSDLRRGRAGIEGVD